MDRRNLTVETGRLPFITDFAESVLVDGYRDHLVFQRAGMLFRIAEADPKDHKHIVRPEGALILHRVTVPMLEDILDRAIRWRSPATDKHPEGKDVPTPYKLAARLLSRAGLWKLPSLVGNIQAPIMRPDGSIFCTNGYDEKTRLYLKSDTEWPALPAPSLAAAQAAVKCLMEPFSEFPYSKPTGISVLISGILTGLQRRLLEEAPAHGFDASGQESGKTLQTSCISRVVTGLDTATMTFDPDEKEFAKKLFASLLEGDTVFLIDNITKPLESDTLAQILTGPSHKARILGVSENKAVPTNVLILLTGNNLEFSKDMPSRVIANRLEPNIERPGERTFRIADLKAHVLERRPLLVTAALTILQSYFSAGRPSQNLKPCRFPQWSHEIREAMVWAGLSDPCETRDDIVATDPEREATVALLENWYAVLGKTEITTRRLITEADRKDNDGKLIGPDLHDAVLQVASDYKNREQISPYRLAKWCRDHAGKVVGDHKLIRCGVHHAGFQSWQIRHVSDLQNTATEVQTAREI
jgi:hypothetical protein